MNLKVKFWLFASVLLLFILIFFGLGTLYFIKFLPSTIGEYLSIIIYRYLQMIFFSTLFFILFYIFVSFVIYTKYIVPFYILTEETKLISKTNPSHRISIKGCKEVCDLSEEINKLAKVIENSEERIKRELIAHLKELVKKKRFLESIVNRVPFGVIVCDKEGIVLFYNDMAKYFLGNTSIFINIGKSVWEFLDKMNFYEALNKLDGYEFVEVRDKKLDLKLKVSFLNEKEKDRFIIVIESNEPSLCKKDSCLCALEELLTDGKTTSNIDIDPCVKYYDTRICLCGDVFSLNPKDLWDKKLKDLTYTVFDLETTGLNPFEGDEILSISAVKIVEGKILMNEIFHQLVDPKRDIPLDSIKIHGITPEMVKGKPPIEEVLKLFYEYAKGSVLVSYNAFFDKAFLIQKETKANVKFDNPFLDVLLLSVLVHPHQKNHSLESIAERLGVKVYPRHTSYGDALTSAEIFIKLIPLLEDKGIHTLKEAWREMQKIKFYSKKYLNVIPA